ncbi:MAG: lipopolysaccharide transport periplasmic protein LptA [Pseudomonadota bacterium]|jgi:lipopolysaccharide export system protein LptA
MQATFVPLVSVFTLISRSSLLLSLSLACAFPAIADKADRAQALSFAADAARVDEVRKLNILTGNVEITKGTMVVQAERVEVRQNPDGTQTATAIAGPKGRAYFRQKREGLDEFIEGEADTVVYDGRDDTVQFQGHAVMRRLKGQSPADEVAGQLITYDNKSNVFQVAGRAPGATTSGRVRGVIVPRAPEAKPEARP